MQSMPKVRRKKKVEADDSTGPPSRLRFVKKCACGRRFDARAWSALPWIGIMDNRDYVGLEREPVLELRLCPCGSTLAIEVSVPDLASAGTRR